MIEELNKTITDGSVLRQGFILRDGFVFVLGDKPAVYDTLLIRDPADAVGPIKHAYASRTLEEHIRLINQYQLEKAKIICRDLSFILRCPSLKEVSIYPDDFGSDSFDYAPLYSMPNLRSVCCMTQYGINGQYKTSVDYPQIRGIREIAAAGQGHNGYETVPSLEILWLSNSRNHRDFQNISCSGQLRDVTLMQCGIQTLDGIEKHDKLCALWLSHNRSLTDINALKSLGNSLHTLAIEGCPKISDFTALSALVKLEHLQLYGSNTLQSLSFLEGMTSLKTFTFTMNVEDGDLTLCRNVPYASCKNRKHFNLKDAQLPKNILR